MRADCESRPPSEVGPRRANSDRPDTILQSPWPPGFPHLRMPSANRMRLKRGALARLRSGFRCTRLPTSRAIGWHPRELCPPPRGDPALPWTRNLRKRQAREKLVVVPPGSFPVRLKCCGCICLLENQGTSNESRWRPDTSWRVARLAWLCRRSRHDVHRGSNWIGNPRGIPVA